MNTFIECDDGWTFIETMAQLVTEQGAESLVRMFENGLEPDERIWQRLPGGDFVIVSGSVRLEWSDHRVILNGMTIIDIGIDRFPDDVMYAKHGCYYETAGHLVFTTDERCVFRMPFVRDTPVRCREWLV